MKTYIAVVMLIIICLVAIAYTSWYMIKLYADVEEMRKTYLDILRSTVERADKYLKEWGETITKWQNTADICNELIKLNENLCTMIGKDDIDNGV